MRAAPIPPNLAMLADFSMTLEGSGLAAAAFATRGEGEAGYEALWSSRAVPVESIEAAF